MPSSPSRRSRLWLPITAAALVACVAWLALRAPRGTVSAAALAEATAEPASAPPRDELGAHAGSDLASRERVADESRPPAPPDLVGAPASDGPKLRLRALRAGSVDPLPGVEFAWLTAPDEETTVQRFWSWFTNSELDEQLAKGATRVLGDERGWAEIPRPTRPLIVAAAAPGWWGFNHAPAHPEPELEITLRPERALAVLVVDGAGRPVAGVPVALRAGFWGGLSDRLRARTAEDGIARLEHVESVLSQGGAQEWSLALAITAAKPIGAPLDVERLPSEPVRLVLPPTGACDVRIVDQAGEAVLESFDVTLGATLPGTDERQRRRSEREGSLAPDVRDGVAEFPFVELGLELGASARRAGGWVQQSVRGLGPKRAGEKVELVLRLGRDVSTLRGRVVDLAGQPLVRRELSLVWRVGEEDSGDLGLGSTKSGDDGVFEVDVRLPADSTRAGTLALELRDPRFGTFARGARPLVLPLATGVNELGDIAVEELPIALAGTVVDPEGNPVASASVRANTKFTPEQQFGGEDQWWASGRTDESGRFELRGQPSRLELEIRATAGELASRAHDARRGDVDVLVRLEQTGAIVGRILRDPGAAGDPLVAGAQLSDPGIDQDGGMAEIASDGGFVLRKLLQGTYDVALRETASWTDLVLIPGVVVRGGEATRDPRLDPIDLRGSRFVVRLTVVDEGGEPVPRGWFAREFADANGEQQSDYGPILNGRVKVAHDGSGATVVIQADGFCVVRLEKVMNDQTVTLRRAPTVELVLRPPPELAPDVRLYASLSAVADDQQQSWIGIGASGRSTQSIPFVGAVVVTFLVNAGGEEDGTWETVAEVEHRIEVRPEPGPQSFELELDPTKLAEAIARARTPPAAEEE